MSEPIVFFRAFCILGLYPHVTMLAREGGYATSARLHAARSFRTAAGLHRLVFHPRAALCGSIPVFNSRMADCVRRFVAVYLGLPVEKAQRQGRMDAHVSAADLKLRLRRRVVGDQRSR